MKSFEWQFETRATRSQTVQIDWKRVEPFTSCVLQS